MHNITDRQLIEKCAVLRGMIKANKLPRKDCGICANLETVAGNEKGYDGVTGRRLRSFFAETDRDAVYPVEVAMHPELSEDEAENLYIHNALNDLLWKGKERKHRIALLNEFVAWLEERVAEEGQ